MDGIAAGKKAAETIGRYLRGEELRKTPEPCRPRVFVEQRVADADEVEGAPRVKPPAIQVSSRAGCFAEVEASVSADQALREARRCLRCDLEFTQREDEDSPREDMGEPTL